MEGLRRSTRSRRYAIFDDYIVYLEKIAVGIKMDKKKTFIEAIESDDSEKWMDGMKDEMGSMTIKNV